MRNRNIVIILFIIFSTEVLAQEKDQIKMKERHASIEIGLVPLAISQENSLGLNFSLTYRRVLNDNLTLSLEGLYTPTSKTDYFGDVSSKGNNGVRSFYDINASLSLDLRYFLKANRQEGHYFGVRVNNLLTLTNIREDMATLTRYSLRPRVKSLPMIGMYYGYRKNITQSLFIDASIGINPHQQPFRDLSISNRELLDFRITLGYTIPLFKKK